MQRQISTTLALVFALATAPVFAAPKMTMEMKAEKDVVVVEKGKQVKKRVEAQSQVSGEVVIYTISYRNEGDEAATNVRFDNKVPEGTAYVADSAKGNADITFSIDNGKNYDKPANLKYEIVNAKGDKEMVVAPPEKYTDIRWILPQVAAGGSGQMVYEVRIK
jgi:uncharacterized repeat protein (TIGR01451 family)